MRTRRYHALLLVATTPPTGRYVLVNGCDAWIEHDGRRFPLSTQCYTPGITSPDGERRLADFSPTPWPGWSFRLEDGIEYARRLGAPLRTIAGCGHLLIGERPEICLAAIEEFVASLPSA